MTNFLKVIVKPDGYPLCTYGTDANGKKCLVFYNSQASLLLELEPLNHLDKRGFQSVCLDCVYWKGKKKVASTRVSASVTPATDDPARLAITVHLKSVIVFTYRDPRQLG